MPPSVERMARGRDEGGSSTFIPRSGEPEPDAVSDLVDGDDNSLMLVSII